MIVDTERDGWTRVGTLGWRKSLRDKHWAQIVKDPLGWAWTIRKADPVTMCTATVADGMDVSLAAAKDDVDHWNRNYHRHAIVVRPNSGTQNRYWQVECRVHPAATIALEDWEFRTLLRGITSWHRECEAAWQRGER